MLLYIPVHEIISILKYNVYYRGKYRVTTCIYNISINDSIPVLMHTAFVLLWFQVCGVCLGVFAWSPYMWYLDLSRSKNYHYKGGIDSR